MKERILGTFPPAMPEGYSYVRLIATNRIGMSSTFVKVIHQDRAFDGAVILSPTESAVTIHFHTGGTPMLPKPYQYLIFSVPSLPNDYTEQKEGPAMYTSFSSLLLLPLISGFGPRPKVGEPAPELKIAKFLQAPADAKADWKDLKGKVVVLEFWATWCGPCVAAIPHLNRLADEFANEPVRFIAITNEKEKVLEPFLKKKRMKAWVAMDSGNATSRAYSVRGIPHTVIVDTRGIIAGITDPASLTAEVLKDVLAGREPKLPRHNDDAESPAKNDPEELPPLFEVVIRKAPDSNSSSGGESTGMLEMSGCDVRSLLARAYDLQLTRVSAEAELPKGKFEIEIKIPRGNREAVHRSLRDALATTFGLRIEREKVKKNVWVLGKANTPPKLQESASDARSSSSNNGTLNATSIHLNELASLLENQLQVPVVNETGLSGQYDVELKWTLNNKESLLAAVEEQLGLKLEQASRSVEVGIIRSIEKKDN